MHLVVVTAVESSVGVRQTNSDDNHPSKSPIAPESKSHASFFDFDGVEALRRVVLRCL